MPARSLCRTCATGSAALRRALLLGCFEAGSFQLGRVLASSPSGAAGRAEAWRGAQPGSARGKPVPCSILLKEPLCSTDLTLCAAAGAGDSRGCHPDVMGRGRWGCGMSCPFPPAARRGRKVPGACWGFSLEEGSLLENTWNLLGLEYGVKVLPPAGS